MTGGGPHEFPHEFGVIIGGGPDIIDIRSPKDLPTTPPQGDARFMQRELRAILELGVHRQPWWFQRFYMIRLWWHRPKYHALAVRAFRAGKKYRRGGHGATGTMKLRMHSYSVLIRIDLRQRR